MIQVSSFSTSLVSFAERRENLRKMLMLKSILFGQVYCEYTVYPHLYYCAYLYTVPRKPGDSVEPLDPLENGVFVEEAEDIPDHNNTTQQQKTNLGDSSISEL